MAPSCSAIVFGGGEVPLFNLVAAPPAFVLVLRLA
jgi:hypothetical protein